MSREVLQHTTRIEVYVWISAVLMRAAYDNPGPDEVLTAGVRDPWVWLRRGRQGNVWHICGG